jgi:TolA-binding protein
MNRKLASILLGTVLLAGCASSTPKPISADARMDRQKFVEQSQRELNAWEKKAKDLKPARANDLRASIQDTRAELRSLQAASDATWMQHRDRVENNLSHIESRFRSAE